MKSMQCSEVSAEVASGLGFDSGWDSMLAWQRWSKSCGRHFSHLSWVSQNDNITCLQPSLKVRDSAEKHARVLRAICVWPRQRQQWLRLKRSTNRANTNKEGHSKKALCELLRVKTSWKTVYLQNGLLYWTASSAFQTGVAFKGKDKHL